jgi:hypothetical protein
VRKIAELTESGMSKIRFGKRNQTACSCTGTSAKEEGYVHNESYGGRGARTQQAWSPMKRWVYAVKVDQTASTPSVGPSDLFVLMGR